MKKIRISKGLKKFLTYALCLALIVGALFGGVAISKALKSDSRTIYPAFVRGGLASADGGYVETEATLYTKNAFECKGLKVTLDFDTSVTYQIFFYDEDNAFVGETNLLAVDFDIDDFTLTAETENVKYARIMIKPDNDGDDISVLDITKYSSQLKIQVAKNQKAFTILATSSGS